MENIAKLMREDLKKAGITSRQVSVTEQSCLYDSSFRVRVKDRNISLQQVKDICNKYLSIASDEKGELLAGGNVYINVARALECELNTVEYYEELENLIKNLDGKNGNFTFLGWNIFIDGGDIFCSNPEYRKKDYFLGKIRLIYWKEVHKNIANTIKEHELDYKYLINQNK